LVERTAGSAVAPAAEDADVMTASRTLKMAERTAEATIAEARDEAAKVVAGAREQHDSIVVARKAAEDEYAAQREAITVDTARWETRKRELVDLFATIEAQLTECDGRLADAHRLVRSALDQPMMAPSVEPVTVATTESVATTPTESVPTAPTESVPTTSTEPRPFVSATIEAGPESAAAPAESDTEESSPKETVFGNPPTPAFTGPAKEDPGTQAFYPWSGKSSPTAPPEADATDSGESTPEPPAPPVQRRGLFGH
jgi:vacuolar-type H+-ATPase subunit H